MQRPSRNPGLGSALGSGAVESAFSGETTQILTKWAIYGIIVFFIAATLLDMVYVLHRKIDGSLVYCIEIGDEIGNFRKFLFKNEKILTNFSEHFGPKEPFTAGSLSMPNDRLLPFLNQN
jgi:hypothetical protein